jgi:hypothetical protein
VVRQTIGLPAGVDMIISAGKPCREVSFAHLQRAVGWALGRVARLQLDDRSSDSTFTIRKTKPVTSLTSV